MVFGLAFSVHAKRRAASQGDGPRICLIAPMGIMAGAKSTLQIRGFKLADATEVVLADAPSGVKAEIKEKKTVEAPAGLDAKDVGDSLAVVELTLPADSTGEFMVSLVTTNGTTKPIPVRILDGSLFLEEKEPNDGFRTAQPLPPGKTVVGAIGKEKDVDVFTFEGRAKKTLVAEVVAAQEGSLLDALITLYDAKGRSLASSDDTPADRDPKLHFTLPADGAYFLAVQDASDRGTAWHTYQLSVSEEP